MFRWNLKVICTVLQCAQLYLIVTIQICLPQMFVAWMLLIISCYVLSLVLNLMTVWAVPSSEIQYWILVQRIFSHTLCTSEGCTPRCICAYSKDKSTIPCPVFHSSLGMRETILMSTNAVAARKQEICSEHGQWKCLISLWLVSKRSVNNWPGETDGSGSESALASRV